MKKILAAIDIARSGGNDMCMKIAQGISGSMDAELVLLYVIESIPGYIAKEIPDKILKERESEAADVLRKLAKQYDCSDIAIREGAPSTEILEYASEIDADLIVLHSQDPGLATYFMGSVASRVVRHAHCSVYIVRQPTERG